jgi:3-hydroxybutyrate dehydrogenase
VKSALCTGMSGSIGGAVVQALLDTGGFVVHGQYRTSSADVERLQAAGATLHQVDFEEAEAAWDLPEQVDVLVNCVGVSSKEGVLQALSLEQVRAVLHLNLEVGVSLAKRYVPGMAAVGYGRVVFINSIWGFRGTTQSLPYVVSKHALSGLTKALAKDYAGAGVTINEVCPAAVESRMMERLAAMEAVATGQDKAAVGRSWRARQTAGRYVTTTEVAAAVSFLVSPAASGINGVSLPVDLGSTC